MIPAHAKTAVSEALAMLPTRMDSPLARIQLYATGLQESRLTMRRQLVGNPPRPVGPAKGLWQFERGGGCIGVINHSSSRAHMQAVCKARGVEFTSAALWNALEVDDVLAAAAARLLYWTEPGPLPARGDVDAAWAYYVNTWRPGKPHRSTWNAFYAEAVAAV